MNNDTCDECGSVQLTHCHDRGEVVCEDCGLVKEVTVEAPWQPGLRDPNHAVRTPIPVDSLKDIRDANQTPLTFTQKKRVRRMRYVQQRVNPRASELLAEIRHILETEFAQDLPLVIRNRIDYILTQLFSRDPSVSAIRKPPSNREDDDCCKQSRVAYLLVIMTYLNELDNRQLPVPEFERRYRIDIVLLNWMKKRIGPTVQGIIGLESRGLCPDEHRRKQLLQYLGLYLVEIEKDEELSRELIQRLRQLARDILDEWDEPLYGPSLSDTPPHCSRHPKYVAKLAIAEASKQLNSLSRSQRSRIKSILRGPTRRGSSTA